MVAATLWTFRCYLTPSGVDAIEEWYEAQPAKLRAKFDTRLRYLQQQPRSAWTRPYFDTLKGECAGLGEVRFEWGNVQHRPIGFFSGELEFTLVFVATERDDKFVPRTACETSQRRKREVLSNRGRAHDCSFE